MAEHLLDAGAIADVDCHHIALQIFLAAVGAAGNLIGWRAEWVRHGDHPNLTLDRRTGKTVIYPPALALQSRKQDVRWLLP